MFLIIVCLGACLFTFIIFRTSCASWIWISVTWLRKFLAIIFSNRFYVSFSSSSGTPIMWMLICLMLYQRALKLYSFVGGAIFIYLFIAVPFGCFPLACLPDCCSILLNHIICSCFLLVYFFTCFTLDNIHVSMLFSQNIPPSPSLTESKHLFCTSVSLFLFCI